MKQPNYKIFGEVTNIKNQYETSTVEKIEGLFYSMWKVVKMVEFYSASTYLGNRTLGVANTLQNTSVGKNKDLMGRDKPFYNIVNYRVMLAKTATDLDIKDIQIVSDDEKHWVKAMFLNKEIYEWMKAENFSLTLNKMGHVRPKYGGYLLKKTERDGKLCIDVCEWKNIACNQINIIDNPIVETHYMSPVAVKKMAKSWENVDEVLKANAKYIQGNKNQTSDITVHEVTGEFPISMLKNAQGEKYSDKDEYEFSLQKYYIADIGGKDYMLFSDELSGEMTDYYKYLSWDDGMDKGLGRGVVEDAEEAQVWTNDSVINEKNAMDLAGRVVLKTNSKKLANNILEVDNGKIFELTGQETLDVLNLAPTALGEFQNQLEKWRTQGDNATSSYDAVTGEQPPSGTPYSQTALLNKVATKPFDYKREEWGIHLTEVFEEWVIPYVIKGLYKEHKLRSDYSDSELDIIDRDFAMYKMNRSFIDDVIAGATPSPEEYQQGLDTLGNSFKKKGNTRYISFPKGYFDDIEAKCTVVTTGEQKDKAAILTSLSEILKTITASFNPNTGTFGALEDPKLSRIMGTILELSGAGISPSALGIGSVSPKPSAPAVPEAAIPSPIQQQALPTK